MSVDATALGDLLGHRFADTALLREALTHASAVNGAQSQTYQRLEFLGDRVLGLVVADMLFEAFPDADEGELSRRLTLLVRKETCADVAEQVGLADHILLGEGEMRSGAARSRGILANVCESIIGAIFLDGGYGAARGFIARHWRETMLAPDRPLRDPKTMLQEWAHKEGHGAPAYRTLKREGPDHEPVFVVEVAGSGFGAATGTGRSKRAAEQAAARDVLAAHGIWPDSHETEQ